MRLTSGRRKPQLVRALIGILVITFAFSMGDSVIPIQAQQGKIFLWAGVDSNGSADREWSNVQAGVKNTNWRPDLGSENRTRFRDGDFVRFGDSRVPIAARSVIVQKDGVKPSSVRVGTVAGEVGYVFTGGTITADLFEKLGTGTWTIKNANEVAIGTTLSNGTLLLGNDKALGSAPLTLSGDSADRSVRIEAVDANRTIANPIAFARLGDTSVTFGGELGLTFTGGVSLRTAQQIFVLNRTTFAGVISNGGADDIGSIIKKGNGGTLVLSNDNTFSGGVVVDAGRLELARDRRLPGFATGTGSVIVGPNATIAGEGRVRSLSVRPAGDLRPGTSPGTIAVEDDLNMDPGSTLGVELDGTQAGAQYDQLEVGGTVSIGDSILDLSLGFVPIDRSRFVIIRNGGGQEVIGRFANFPEEGDTKDIFTPDNKAVVRLKMTYFGTDENVSGANNVVLEVVTINRRPEKERVGDKQVNEGQTLLFPNPASDPDGDHLTYSLLGAPVGATIDSETGEFSWTPTEEQGPGVYPFTIQVTDDGEPPLSDSEQITVTVNEVNQAPILSPIGSQLVNEGGLLSFTATASDADIPANTLTFSLLGAPDGATINPNTGAFTWTPSESQGPGIYDATIRVTDNGVNVNNLFDEQTIQITVNEVNEAPVLAPIGDITVTQGAMITLTASATDVDIPANALTYGLAESPGGAAIDSTTGTVTWTADEPGQYLFTVEVTDDGDPSLSDTEDFTVTVIGATPTPTPTPTNTPTPTSTKTPTNTPTPTSTPTLTPTPTQTPTSTPTQTPTVTSTPCVVAAASSLTNRTSVSGTNAAIDAVILCEVIGP